MESEAKCLLYPWNEKIMQLEVFLVGGLVDDVGQTCIIALVFAWTTSPAGSFFNAVYNKFTIYKASFQGKGFEPSVTAERRGFKVLI